MQLTPYIMFNGTCEEALNFYEKALDGQIKDLMRFEGSPAEGMSNDKQKVMHAHFSVDGQVLFMASDSGMEGTANPGQVHLSINFTDAGHIEKTFEALCDGAKVTMPLQDTFWGATFGMLTDRFGVNWMFNYDKPRSS
jgi:PhnB protein